MKRYPFDMPNYTVSDFDYELPAGLIAQHPLPQRSAARLLDGSGAQPADRLVRDLPGLLRAGDVLVCNDTRVVRARLFGRKSSGGALELLVERVLADGSVAAHMRASRKPQAGSVLEMEGGFTARVLGRWPDAGGALFHLRFSGDAYALMHSHGHVPLPPYIERADEADDAARYQTVFARRPGAVAAPTASLHFDEPLLAAIDARGVQRVFITLHVGAGTFQPIKGERIEEHVMHSERYEVPPQTQQAIAAAKERGARIVAVGTTCVRALEAWAATGAASGDTALFITPGYPFGCVDALLTNFHLPRSTLLMLVAAFAGYDRVRALYAHALQQGYRFFSYGDAMWLRRAASG